MHLCALLANSLKYHVTCNFRDKMYQCFKIKCQEHIYDFPFFVKIVSATYAGGHAIYINSYTQLMSVEIFEIKKVSISRLTAFD